MFQLPLLGSGGNGLMKGAGADGNAAGMGLDGLFVGGEGQLAAFSGELQAMLMQMSPQMLQQLEAMLAGGMSLPQAARSLLAEAGAQGQGDLFLDLLEQGLPKLEDSLEAGTPGRQSGQDAMFSKLAGELRSADAGLLQGGAGKLAAAAAMGATAPNSGPLSLQQGLSPQLTASLLDMGVPQQVGARGWDGAIADRVMWMVQGEQQFAKLRLNPPNLGPLEVRVTVNQDQTSVAFLAQHAAVREALEAALPRLREMFDQQSLDLVRADVSDPGAQQGEGTEQADTDSAAASGHFDAEGEAAAGEQETGAGALVHGGDRLVDLFA